MARRKFPLLIPGSASAGRGMCAKGDTDRGIELGDRGYECVCEKFFPAAPRRKKIMSINLIENIGEHQRGCRQKECCRHSCGERNARFETRHSESSGRCSRGIWRAFTVDRRRAGRGAGRSFPLRFRAGLRGNLNLPRHRACACPDVAFRPDGIILTLQSTFERHQSLGWHLFKPATAAEGSSPRLPSRSQIS